MALSKNSLTVGFIVFTFRQSFATASGDHLIKSQFFELCASSSILKRMGEIFLITVRYCLDLGPMTDTLIEWKLNRFGPI